MARAVSSGPDSNRRSSLPVLSRILTCDPPTSIVRILRGAVPPSGVARFCLAVVDLIGSALAGRRLVILAGSAYFNLVWIAAGDRCTVASDRKQNTPADRQCGRRRHPSTDGDKASCGSPYEASWCCHWGSISLGCSRHRPAAVIKSSL